MDAGDLNLNLMNELREAEKEYTDFFDDAVKGDGKYDRKIKKMIDKGECRVIVNINDLRQRNETRAKKLLGKGFEEIAAFQNALKNMVAANDTDYSKKHEEFHVGFEGSFGSKHVTPRTLTSRHLGGLVCLEGIVTKCSLVRPKVVRTYHFCPATKKTISRRYADMTSYNTMPTSNAYPTKDEDNNPLETEFGMSVYKDHQTLTIQEMPEKAPAGQLPRSIDIVVDNDLVDSCKPGDRVQVVGSFRCLPGKKNGFTTGVFRTVLVANNVAQLSKDLNPLFSVDDVEMIKKFSKQKGSFDILANSLAPSIHGHEYIKKAVLCMLLGGEEKILSNGSRLRGDINILLIGDPSTAKSQMLRYVLYTAPRAVTTTGRGTTGVGLTAAVTKDEETGERRLEAGAMVLADRGIVCIDEFDKMSDIDRTAIHEVMEQGRVTVAKAGIHAKLNARCSVLAAANPVFGRYDQYKPPMDNIGMQDSLLSRFDLLFIVLDEMEAENDRRISDHVLRMHRYRNPNEEDGAPLPITVGAEILSTKDLDKENDGVDKPLQKFEKHNELLHGNENKNSKQRVTIEFLKKYIHLTKSWRAPVLSKKAAERITEEYARLRSQDQESTDIARTTPVTARTLETLIRLATAHAKAHFRKSITEEDAEMAIELVQFAYFHKVEEKMKKRKRKNDGDDNDGGDDDDNDDDDGEDDDDTRRNKRARRRGAVESEDVDMEDSEATDATPSTVNGASSAAGTSSNGDHPSTSSSSQPSQARLQAFKSAVHDIFRQTRESNLPLADILKKANEMAQQPFSPDEVSFCLSQMQEENQVMVADETVFLV